MAFDVIMRMITIFHVYVITILVCNIWKVKADTNANCTTGYGYDSNSIGRSIVNPESKIKSKCC